MVREGERGSSLFLQNIGRDNFRKTDFEYAPLRAEFSLGWNMCQTAAKG